jgi:D-alanyl-D-alanine carboxypeptidase/D-alanyl-D-alanine-endopeptidase (penicillin-binding protein 4)
MRISLLLSFLLSAIIISAQSVTGSLKKAMQEFETDPQLKHATVSLYVIDAKTGKIIFDKNSQVGLAPASTEKVITSATAFELLGNDFRYQTNFSIGEKDGKSIIYIQPSGDPTLGSWRWEQTKEENVIKRLLEDFKKNGVNKPDKIIINAQGWNTPVIPGEWLWEDMGNYYGAGAGALNWRENQFDLVLKSGSRIGDTVTVKETRPPLYDYKIMSLTTAAEKGSGDNAYVYLPLAGNEAMVTGTIPVNENNFIVSGAMPDAAKQFVKTLADSLKMQQSELWYSTSYDADENSKKIIHVESSPALDSMVYWFLKKSINLYGEVLIKTIALKEKGVAATDSGISVIKEFWKQRGIDPGELNIYDGSGLSPVNRVTTHAQVTVLNYAKHQKWFRYFYDALPEYNKMKMKSGTIGDVKGFCGYHTSAKGRGYIFSFLVNNYNDTASTLVNKMYKVLDLLR